MHTIGIDFGTTKTLVSRIVAETGRPETVRLGQGKDHITTSVFIMNTGEMVFGDEADDRMADPDGVYLRGFKMSLGSSTPVHVQMNSEGEMTLYKASDIVMHFMRYIRTRVQNTVFAGDPVTRAIITRPVEFSPARCEELRQAAIAAGFEEVELTTEPEAAGLAFCRLNDVNAFRHSALIIDWGGGTLDIAHVTREGDRIITHPEYTAGDMTMGGELFDELLWKHVESTLQEKGISHLNHISSLPVIRKNKEKLSFSTNTTLHLSHKNGTCPPIELSRSFFERLISNSLTKAANKIKQLLARIPDADKPEKLLLVGGSCRIPYIQRRLEKASQLPAVSWHLSREAVALGAALWNFPVRFAHTAASVQNDEKIGPLYIPGFHILKGALVGLAIAGGMGALISKCNNDKKNISEHIDEEEILRRDAKKRFDKIPREEYTKHLFIAAASNDFYLLELLINVTNINTTDGEDKTPLYWAARNGHHKCVELLIKNRANVNKADQHDKTPLYWAADGGHTECVRLLINAGADVNKAGSNGKTPLYWAEKNGHTECARLLRMAGAVASRDNDTRARSKATIPEPGTATLSLLALAALAARRRRK